MAAMRGDRRKRPNYWRRRLLVLLLLLLPAAIWKGWSAISGLPIEPEEAAPRVAAGQPVYVIVMGVDEREEDVGRTDTLILVRLDLDGQGVGITNIPRDTLVTWPSGKQGRINSAYAIGGAREVAGVVANLLDIPQPYYVTLNFQSFIEVVNLIGGVEVDVPHHYVYEDPLQDLYINISAGPQTMRGDTALKYVRLRYDGFTNSDIARIERQQQFITAMKEKLSSPVYWSRIPAMLKSVRKHIKTNLPESDQIRLAEAAFKARDQVKMLTLPGEPDDETGDWLFDKQAWNEVIKSWSVR